MSAPQFVTEWERELYAALQWALPLAEIAMEDCRLLRLRSGHSDIGTKRVGLYDDEVAQIAVARAVLAKATTTEAE